MEFFKPGRVFDFMGVRWFWIPLSLLARRRLGRSSASYPGPNYGTDFKGGTEVEIAFGKPLDAAERAHAPSSPWASSRRTSCRSSTTTARTTSSSACRTSARSPTRRRTRSAAPSASPTTRRRRVADAAKCPDNARATEVKFSAGGDKISTRYDVDPDLEKVKDAGR